MYNLQQYYDGDRLRGKKVVTSAAGNPPVFTNDPLVAGETTVQSLHITELRNAINQVRGQRGLAAFSWQTAATTNDWITAAPILEMRTALDQALGAPPSPGYSAGLAPGQPILAIHIQELRERVKAAQGAAAPVTTYYLRSTVLGGQVVAELNGSGIWVRGYVYLGGQLLAVQQNGAVSWMHEDPVAKSKRVTDSAGNVVSTVELDPWGGETNRSSNEAFQPKKFTSYERDENGSDEAMHRRYNRWWGRFEQPDPYDGSYSLADPQSFNRYSYVQNDPVNFVDPLGLFCVQRELWDEKTATLYIWEDCYLEDGGGGPGFMPIGGGGPGGGGPGTGTETEQEPAKPSFDTPNYCQKFADIVAELAKGAKTSGGFVYDLQKRLLSFEGTAAYDEFKGKGFKVDYRDDGPGGSFNQVRHFVGTLGTAYLGIIGLPVANPAAALVANVVPETAYQTALALANSHERNDASGRADMALNKFAVRAGVNLALGLMSKNDLAKYIRDNLCE